MAEDWLQGIALVDGPERQAVGRTLDLYLKEMLRWNRRINLTSITDFAVAREKHILDALSLLPLIDGVSSILDMGSGAGLPGVPLQVVCPDLRVVSVDSVTKKISFQRHVKRLLNLENFEPICARLEHLDQVFEKSQTFSVVTCRAFSSLRDIVRFAAPWLAPTGKILAMKGPDGRDEWQRQAADIIPFGFVLSDVYDYQLPRSASQRQVLVLKKSP